MNWSEDAYIDVFMNVWNFSKFELIHAMWASNIPIDGMGWDVNIYRCDDMKNYCCDDNSDECEYVEVAYKVEDAHSESKDCSSSFSCVKIFENAHSVAKYWRFSFTSWDIQV